MENVSLKAEYGFLFHPAIVEQKSRVINNSWCQISSWGYCICLFFLIDSYLFFCNPGESLYFDSILNLFQYSGKSVLHSGIVQYFELIVTSMHISPFYFPVYSYISSSFPSFTPLVGQIAKNLKRIK